MKDNDELKREMNLVRSEANLRTTLLENAHKTYLLSLDRLLSEAEVEFYDQITFSHKQLRRDLLELARKHGFEYLEEDEE